MNRPAIYSFALSAIALVCGTFLTAIAGDAPDAVWLIATGGLGAGGMAATLPAHRAAAEERP
jgi:hypothetical protein